MITTAEEWIRMLRDLTIAHLRNLGISPHRNGYKYLTVVIPCYAMDPGQSLTKEVYPYVASYFGCADWHSVERSIRLVVQDAWERRDLEIWAQYFRNQKKVPSNKQFIAVLAEKLR